MSVTQALDKVNAEDDGEEDQAGPPVDTPMANMPAAFTSAMSSLFPPAPDTLVSLEGTPMPVGNMPTAFTSAMSSLFPPAPDAAPLGGTPMANMPAAFTSAMSSLFPPSPDTVSLGGTSSSRSDVMPPPLSSSISPTTHPGHASHSQKRHVSVNSVLSHTTSSLSDTQTTSSKRKRKRDATGDMPPPTSKRTSKNKTDTLNPVIISSQLNSTLIRLADVMEKSLDVTATSTSIEAPTTTHMASSHASSIPSQLPGLPSTLSSTVLSDSEVLDKALGIVTVDKDFLSEDDLPLHSSSLALPTK